MIHNNDRYPNDRDSEDGLNNHASNELQGLRGRRKRRTVTAGVVGGTAGLLFGGPIGAIVVGVGSAVVAKRVNRRKEREFLDAAQSRKEAARRFEIRMVPTTEIVYPTVNQAALS